MEAVIRIAGTTIVMLVIFSLEIFFLPQYHQLETNYSYHTKVSMTMELKEDFLLHLHLVRKWQILTLFNYQTC